MKKTLLIISFSFATLLCNAQKTFVEKYTSYVTNINDITSETKIASVTIIFNAEDTTDILIYTSDSPKRLYRTGEIINGKSNGGFEYQLVNCIDSETGKQVIVQLFKDACRVFMESDYIEYDK
jgi:hypothetical protein